MKSPAKNYYSAKGILFHNTHLVVWKTATVSRAIVFTILLYLITVRFTSSRYSIRQSNIPAGVCFLERATYHEEKESDAVKSTSRLNKLDPFRMQTFFYGIMFNSYIYVYINILTIHIVRINPII